MMINILIGIPSIRVYSPFWASLDKFVSNAKEFYDVEVFVVQDELLYKAQNKITDKFLSGTYDYLLMMDDDHSGHTVKMLDCLIEAKTNVAVMKTYSRHYPYSCTLIKYIGNNLAPVEFAEGYKEVDLAGFPMTLIRRDTFDLLDKPYFRQERITDRDWVTDVDFFRRLNDVDIKPIGCYQHCLNHDIVTSENVNELRAEGSREERNKALLIAFNVQKDMYERSL